MLANDASQKNISHNPNWGLAFGLESIVSPKERSGTHVYCSCYIL